VSFSGDQNPNSYYLYDRDSKKASLIFDARPKLAKYKLAKMQSIEFTARDGMKIYGYLTLPVGVEGKNLPLVLDVHGGPWARNIWGYNGAAQWLANRGYAVLNINFRGSTGYGKDYLNAGDREWALLVAQGANDVRVKQSEGDQLAAAMRKNGKPIEYIVFPKEGHGFAKPEDYIKFRAREEAFLAKYLSGRLEPIAEAEKSDDLLH
jgi:dipeptidyl aminopeptidase/acylaminoacyl peptidase